MMLIDFVRLAHVIVQRDGARPRWGGGREARGQRGRRPGIG